MKKNTTIIFIFLLSCASFSTNNSNQIDMNIKTFLNQFHELSLPYSEKQLAHVFLENDGRDGFDESLFEALAIKPIQNHQILPKDNVYYPVGKISGKAFTIILAMNTKYEAGLIDPVVTAFLLDHKQGVIQDSLEIYYNLIWESVYNKKFVLTKDTVFKIQRYLEYDPFYGETENADSMHYSVIDQRELVYQIQPEKLKFIRYYEQDGDYANEWEKGKVQNHTREGSWEDIDAPYMIESNYSKGIPIGEWKYYIYEEKNHVIGNQLKTTRKKSWLSKTEKYQDGELVERKEF